MPSGIIIIGLGPGSSQYWTRAAYTLLQQANEVYLRTVRHPAVVDIPAVIYHFDDLYQQISDLNQVNDRIAAEIVRLGQRDEGVIYAVPGDPAVGESTVPHIRSLAADQGLPVTIIPGISFLEPALAALHLNVTDNLQIADAVEIALRHHPPLAPDQPALVAGLSNELSARVKQVLLNAYPTSLVVTLIPPVVVGTEQYWTCPLAELDHQSRLDQLTTLYLPATSTHIGLATFQETVAHLRAPEGCPWDRKQTHQSLRPYLLEETYEVLEALDSGDLTALAEELGDLLLQIALHAQIATDLTEFQMGEVIGQINRKLLRRHPHVFGNVVVAGVEDVITNWEAIKQNEKAERNRTGESGLETEVASALAGIPRGLPALAQALAVSKKAVQVGFEWPDIEGVLDNLIEEAREITEATTLADLEAEIGDLLFSAVNLARWRNVDPESALRATNVRFTRRFQKLEALAAAQGKTLPDMSIEEMDALWNEAKRLTR